MQAKISRILKKEQTFSLLLILITLVILIIPVMGRGLSEPDLMVGEESYYHARIAREILEAGSPYSQDIIGFEREYTFNPYHYFLAAASFFAGILNASRFLPIILGVLFVFLLDLVLKKEFNISIRLLIFFALISSPIFIYLFSTSNAHALPLVMLALGLYLFSSTNRIIFVCAIVLFSLLPLFGLMHFLFLFGSLLLYSIKHKDHFRPYLALSISTVLGILYWLFVFKRFINIDLVPRRFIETVFFIFGAELGFSSFMVILAVIGIVLSWKNRRSLIVTYVAIIMFLMYSYFVDYSANIFLNIILAFYAGYAFFRILKLNWSVKIIKHLTLLSIILGMLFSTMVCESQLIHSSPSISTINALDWFESQYPYEENVFSHHRNSYYLEYFGDMHVMLDKRMADTDSMIKRYNDSQTILYSMNLKKTKEVLKSYKIDYILITEDMKEGLVWNEPDKGLMHILEDNETFELIYSTDATDIWWVRDT